MQLLKGLAPLKISSAQKLRREGDAARDRKEWQTAAGFYRRYLEVAADDSDIWIQLGHAAKEQENLSEAEAAYRRAAAITPAGSDARIHLGHLLKRLGRSQQAVAVFQELMAIAPTPEVIDELKSLGYGDQALTVLDNIASAKVANGKYLELRDLFGYLSLHTTVTGITRVVLGLVNYVLDELEEEEASSYYFVSQYGDAEGLSLLSKPKLRQLVHLAIAETPDLDLMNDLIVDIKKTAPLIKLQAGDLYFIPGAFWDFVTNPSWLSSMKQRGIYIGCYIYDLIPITHAHYCMAELTDAFNVAFSETARFCDFTLTISEFVANQVKDFVKAHHIAPFPTIAAPLAHELHFDTTRKFVKQASNADIELLEDRPFVLCVCTIEARKNHIYLFYIWQQMIDAGIDVPDLVLVGRHGWRIHDLLSQIEASRNLDGRLHIMHGLSDADLALLYERCLFTVFPSFVEGWGLPVGESLAYGKVCVASSTTSIPEVGGKFALYVDPFNLDSGYQTIRKLIAEPAYLAGLEANIRKNFIPRTWKDVGRDFFTRLDRTLSSLPPFGTSQDVFAPSVKPGEVLEMSELRRAGKRRSEYAENPLRLIFVQGWRGIEDTGTWMKDNMAKLRVHTAYPAGQHVSILLSVSTSPWVDKHNTLRVWASEGAIKRTDVESETYYTKATRKDSRFWIRLKGKVDEANMITVQIRVDGAIVPTDPTAIPVSLRLHSIGFSAAEDYAMRMDLLEQMLLPSS